MKRLVPVFVLCLALGGLWPVGAGAATTTTLDSHCSPTGDYCIAIERKQGEIYASLRTFSFRGQYKLCLKAPLNDRECGWWKLHKRPHGIYAGKVSLRKRYFTTGPGRYTVSWFGEDERQIGRGLHFGKS